MKKKIKRFQRLATIRKKDVSKEINNSNLLQNEITKNGKQALEAIPIFAEALST